MLRKKQKTKEMGYEIAVQTLLSIFDGPKKPKAGR